jgi:hypothetical protein
MKLSSFRSHRDRKQAERIRMGTTMATASSTRPVEGKSPLWGKLTAGPVVIDLDIGAYELKVSVVKLTCRDRVGVEDFEFGI